MYPREARSTNESKAECSDDSMIQPCARRAPDDKRVCFVKLSVVSNVNSLSLSLRLRCFVGDVYKLPRPVRYSQQRYAFEKWDVRSLLGKTIRYWEKPRSSRSSRTKSIDLARYANNIISVVSRNDSRLWKIRSARNPLSRRR